MQKPNLQSALEIESQKFEKYYLWVQDHLPPRFFEAIDSETLIFVVHTLMDFDTQNYFSHIHVKNMAIALCLESSEADLHILRHYQHHTIRSYRTFVSNTAPPFLGISSSLKVALIYFTEKHEATPLNQFQEIFAEVKKRHPTLNEKTFQMLLDDMNARFLRSLTKERLILAFDVLFRAQKQEACQIEVLKKTEGPSLQIVLAWRSVPQQGFLYRLARLVHRYGLDLMRMSATMIEAYTPDNILLMSIGLHGAQGKSAWEEANISEFLQELASFKYFPGEPLIETTFIDSKLVSGTLGNLLKTMVHFIHQVLVHGDPYLYSFAQIEEGLCRHPELAVMLTQAFEWKFHPEKHDLNQYNQLKNQFLALVDKIDTGQEASDNLRKQILKQGLNFIDHTLKTNFYRPRITAYAFRLNPCYLDAVPYNRVEKFPELPFAIFFMKGLQFTGFHIRFRDLARGGLRTVRPEQLEAFVAARNQLFSECYNLACTQQKKNKDIPEGGAKGVILLEPYEPTDELAYRHDLEASGLNASAITEKLKTFQDEQKLHLLYQSQRAYIESFTSLINCESDGKLRAHPIIDYYQKPEYIYLGPDENMHNDMIVWICNWAKSQQYKPGSAFMSSKPGAGINHKEFGVTSRGVNVYMEEVLKFLGIDPQKQTFTVKMTGGPDGDVAGNQMHNLFRLYPKTAKLLATIDISGTIYDPQGLDLALINHLFEEGKPIRFYPSNQLSEGGFLLDTKTQREQTAYVQQTLLLRKQNGKIVEEWISGNEMNHLLRTHIHQVKADVFIPGGGRPRTLNDHNWRDFLDVEGKPTSKAIVEGGNLYLSPEARRALEKLGVIIIKDSSANKGGVICSSFEVLSSLVLSEEEFLKIKPQLVQEILTIIESRSKDEAQLLLSSHGQAFLTDISDWVSERINAYTDELNSHLLTQKLSDALIQALLNYCPPILRSHFADRILKEVPDVHKKAIIACFLAQRLVYRKGLSWSPSIVDVLPIIVNDPHMTGP